jgi:hypothetical protein
MPRKIKTPLTMSVPEQLEHWAELLTQSVEQLAESTERLKRDVCGPPEPHLHVVEAEGENDA